MRTTHILSRGPRRQAVVGFVALLLSLFSGGSGLAVPGEAARPAPSSGPPACRLEPALPAKEVYMVQRISAATVPADFSLEMSSGGGFSGVYQGHRVTADGRVVRWRTGPNAGARNEEPLGTAEPAALLRLVEALESTKFFETKLEQPGNMTVVLTATMNGRQHSVRYPLPMEQHPDAVRPIVEALKAVIRPLEKAKE